MTYDEAARREHEELVNSVIEILRKQEQDFEWCPSLEEGTFYKKDELIRELEKGTAVGREFLKVTMAGTVSRLARANR